NAVADHKTIGPMPHICACPFEYDRAIAKGLTVPDVMFQFWPELRAETHLVTRVDVGRLTFPADLKVVTARALDKGSIVGVIGVNQASFLIQPKRAMLLRHLRVYDVARPEADIRPSHSNRLPRRQVQLPSPEEDPLVDSRRSWLQASIRHACQPHLRAPE